MKPVADDGTVNLGRPYVPVGAVFGFEEDAAAMLAYHEGRWPVEL